MTETLASQSAATASAILALTVAALITLTAAVVLTLSRTRDDTTRQAFRSRRRDLNVPSTRSGRGVRGHGPAGLDWIPDPHPRRTRGQLITWTPDDDTPAPLDPPPDPDYRRGNDT